MDDELQTPSVAETPVSQTVTTPKKSGGKKSLAVLLVLLLVVAAAGGVYYWQSKKTKEATAQVQKLNAQITELNKQLADAKAAESKSTTEADTKSTSTDDLVLAAAEAYCEAGVDPTTKKALVFTAGTTGTSQKKVVYSVDKVFARVNAGCSNSSEVTAESGSGSLYTLKFVNNDWVVVYKGQMASEEATKLYDIPTTFN